MVQRKSAQGGQAVAKRTAYFNSVVDEKRSIGKVRVLHSPVFLGVMQKS